MNQKQRLIRQKVADKIHRACYRLTLLAQSASNGGLEVLFHECGHEVWATVKDAQPKPHEYEKPQSLVPKLEVCDFSLPFSELVVGLTQNKITNAIKQPTLVPPHAYACRTVAKCTAVSRRAKKRR